MICLTETKTIILIISSIFVGVGVDMILNGIRTYGEKK
jgi:hypothetical protein